MTKRPRNIAASVRARLLHRSRESREDFQFLLQRYAAERFLYRLGESSHRNSYVLKGAMLFPLWGGSIYRPTRDLDFTGYGSNESDVVVAALREICQLSVVDDGLIFDSRTLAAEPIRNEAEYNGLRIRFQATLDNARISMQVDIGFGNAIEPPATEADYPTLLDGPAPRIRAYPQEAVVAEKLHAMAVLGERNSRYRDFYDLHVLARQFPFAGERLAGAIAATFERRRTPVGTAIPAALAPRFYVDNARGEQWRAYLTRNSLPGAPRDFAAVGEVLQAFLVPAWTAVASNVVFASAWRAGGPWFPALQALHRGEWSRVSRVRRVQRPESRGTGGDPPESRRADLELESASAGGGVVRQPQMLERAPASGRSKPYPTYKDTAIEWLGQIPAHWEVQRLKDIASVQLSNVDKKSLEGEEAVRLCNYTDVYYNEHITSDLPFMPATATRDQVRRYSLRAGDVLITKDSESWSDIAVPAVVAEDLPDVLCGYHLAHVRPKQGCYGPFLARAFAAVGPRDQFRIAANGITRFGLGGDAIRAGVFPVPPESEQRAIATFLDRETGRIDALVAKKERLIKLLREKRSALITRAMTKGLDPNARMRDSGVDWLGKIPSHWEVVPLKRLLVERVANGLFKTREAWDSGAPIINVIDVYREDFHIEIRNLERVVAEADELTRFSAEPGDIFFVRSSLKREGVGASALLGEISQPSVFECHLVRARPNADRVLNRYLAMYLNASIVRQRLISISETTTMTTIAQGGVENLEVLLPPKTEQHKLVTFSASEMARIDLLIGKVRGAIGRLLELRTALISAAVTGKIDVRGEAA